METQDERLEEITLQLDRETTLLTHWVPLLDNCHIRGVVAVFHTFTLKKA